MAGYRVYIESLGCPKNTADSEYMAGILRSAGCEIVKDPGQADVVLVNTCGFIEPAKEESIDTILEFAELKKEDLKKLIVAGCLYERYKGELKEELPEVDDFLGVHELERVSEVVVGKSVYGSRLYEFRELLEKPYIGYLKIADGCSNGCTFCAIPLIKGGFKSRPIDELVGEANVLAEKGVKELYIIAQDTTAYMFERGLKNQLVELLKELEDIDGIEWIRIMYTYPSFITDELIDFMASSKKVVHYLDVPFQHASDRVLKDMGRVYTRSDMEKLLQKLRDKIPDIAIRSTFIVGFPTETDADFEELLDFLENARLDWSGFFKYYHEEGTISFGRYEDIEDQVKQERLMEAENLASSITEEINDKFIGKSLKVLIDGESEDLPGYYTARSYRSAYEIDGAIYVKGNSLEEGEFVIVNITDTINPFDLEASFENLHSFIF